MQDWTFRRIVVGTDESGRAHFARAEPIELAAASKGKTTARWQAWAEDQLPVRLPADGRAPGLQSRPTPEDTPAALSHSSILPLPGGVRIAWYEFGPDYVGSSTTPMHWHDSWEAWYIVQGEVVLILDSGAEMTLRRGDTVINLGTNHKWENRSGASALAALVCLGAVRDGPAPPAENDMTRRMTAEHPRSAEPGTRAQP